MLAILLDATEQLIQRPKKKKTNKKYYSGKKKCHTQKIELRMTSQGKITNIFRSSLSRQHDFNLREQSNPLPPDATAYADSGYQGLQHDHPHTRLPHKKPKGDTLTA